jgi:hypothetical protein
MALAAALKAATLARLQGKDALLVGDPVTKDGGRWRWACPGPGQACKCM